MLRKRLLWPVLAVVLVLLAAGCGSNKSSSTAGGASKSTGFKFAVVTHGQASDPFWSVVKNGVEPADRRGGGLQAGRPGGVDPRCERPRALDQEGGRSRHPGRVDQLRQRRLQEPRRPHPRRPD